MSYTHQFEFQGERMVFTTDFEYLIVKTTSKYSVNKTIRGNQYYISAYADKDQALTAMFDFVVKVSDNHVAEGNTVVSSDTEREVYAKGETRFNYDGNCYDIVTVQELVEQFSDNILVRLVAVDHNAFKIETAE